MKPSLRQSDSPAGIIVRAFFLGSVLWFAIPWLTGLMNRDPLGWFEGTPVEARAQLRAIRHRLDLGEAEAMDRFFPEGKLFAWSFYGFSLVNIATQQKDDPTFTTMARSELQRIIPILDSMAEREPFTKGRNLKPRGGIIAAGHPNLLRAGYVILGGTDAPTILRFHESSRELHEHFMKSRVASLESYPGQIWLVDNLVALESLRLHDVLYQTHYAEACRKWERWASAHLDAHTGMMVMQIDENGAVLDGPRGCGLSWSLAFMPTVAPELARTQYERYRREWFVQVLGITGIREFPTDRQGWIDADTGPVVCGIGAAASGFGIAASKANGDIENFRGMLRGMELLSAPTWNWQGQKHYFFKQVLLADELALWGKTLRRWDGLAGSPQNWPTPQQSGWWLILLPVVLVVVLIAAAAWRSLHQQVRAARARQGPWSVMQRVMVAIDIMAIATWLVIPQVNWLYAMLVMGGVDIIERRITQHRCRTLTEPAPPAGVSGSPGD